MSAYKLTYFDIRGLGEPIRLLFALAGVPFEDVRMPYTPGAPGVLTPDVKAVAPYGQVPLLEFDGVVLSQSGTIGRFLSKRFNLHGKDDLESARIDELTDAMKDYRDGCVAIFLAKDDEARAKAKDNFVQVLTPKYATKFSEILEKNGSGFLVGESATWADVMLFNFAAQIALISDGDFKSDFPAIGKMTKKFEDIPQIKQYLATRPDHPW